LQMGVHNIARITDGDLLAKGVTQKEFSLVKKLIALDPEIFAARELFNASESPFMYTVDLSKYQGPRVTKELKDVIYRPKKMRQLFDCYWRLAQDVEQEVRKDTEFRAKSRFIDKQLMKSHEQSALLERVVKVIDTTVRAKEQAEVVTDPIIKQVQELVDREQMVTDHPKIFFYRDGFEKET